MKPGLSLAFVLVPALGVATSQEPPARPEAGAEAKPAAPAMSRPEKRTVAFDLLASERSDPVVLTAPRAEFFNVILKNRAPSGSYRVRHDLVLDPATPGRPAERALHDEYELEKPHESRLHPMPGAPPCLELQDRAFDVVRVRDEAELPEKLRVFRAKNGEGGCPQFAHLEPHLVAPTVDVELRTSHRLHEGDELQFTVERFEPASGTVLRAWRFSVRAQPLSLGWTYPNEEVWIVGETSHDIAEMILYSRDHSLPPQDKLGFAVVRETSAGTSPRYLVRLSPSGGGLTSYPLSFESSIWSPESYQPLAAGLIRELGLQPSAASAEGLLGETVTHPVSRALAQEGLRLSRQLEKAMLDPGAHEQAALLIGVLALREIATARGDIRQPLCRMAAHMALARALRHGTASPLAGYAEALLLTLVNRQRDALLAIERLEQANPPASWAALARALRIRITRDWRVLREPAKATLLERLEQYHALQRSLGPSAALAFFESFEAEPIGDWGRLTFAGGASVEQGHLFAASLPALEMKEAAEVWKVLFGKDLPPEKLVEALNAEPRRLLAAERDGKPAVGVIGWGCWARFFQRNLCFAAQESVGFLESQLGLQDEARQQREQLTQHLSALELWPSLSLKWWRDGLTASGEVVPKDDQVRRDACTRALAVAQGAPERLPNGSWWRLHESCPDARDTRLAERWLSRVAPAGTVLLDGARHGFFATRVGDAQRLFEELHGRAPFHALVLELLPPDGRNAPYSVLAARYGPLLDYNLDAMRALLSASDADPSALRPIYERMANLVPEWSFSLGHYLVDADLDDAAAAAFEKGIAEAHDRVAVSVNLRWLVGHYCDRSRIERATEVAEIGAEVYSGAGLGTMGYLMERLGRYGEAEQWYQKIPERYGADRRSDLDEFYIRYEQRVGDGRYASQATTALGKLFPSGLERVSLADLSSPPAAGEGVRISGRSQSRERFGLHEGDVIVAFNGYRVRNGRQYGFLWTLDDKPQVTIIVWRQDRYLELKGVLKRLAYGPVSRPT